MTSSTLVWQPEYIRGNEFSNLHLQRLINGEIPAIVIDDFYPLNVCQIVAERFKNIFDIEEYSLKNISSSYLGNPVCEMFGNKDEYFKRAPLMMSRVTELFNELGIETPLEMVISLLKNGWNSGAEVAREGSKQYFAGVVRVTKSSGLHNDLASRDFRWPTLKQVSHQLVWNLYLQKPDSNGGKLRIWDREWSPLDEQHKLTAGTMGYTYDVVNGATYADIEPLEGRLVFFKTTNFHEVLRDSGNTERLSIASFIGVINDQEPLILWS